MILRIAVTMTEAWLMSDRERFAEYFHVAKDRVPIFPEDVEHAKKTLLSVVERSRRRHLRVAVTATTRDGVLRAGPAYVPTVNDFAILHWRPRVAAQCAPSLRRALREIEAARESGRWPS